MSTPRAYAVLWVGLSGGKDEKVHWKSLVHDREGRLDPWFGDEVELPRFDDDTWARAWLLSHPGERALVEVEAAKQIYGEDRVYAEPAYASPVEPDLVDGRRRASRATRGRVGIVRL